jgi:endonuclease I
MKRNHFFKKTIVLIYFLANLTLTWAQVPADYYDGISGSGYTLKTNLHNLIKGHTSRTYSDLWTDMQSTDNDGVYENDGSVLDMYSENPTGTDPYNFTWGSDQCGNYSGENSCYNREHSFPKSWFSDGYPMYTDLFHLYPTDGYVNGQRGNYPFGETDSPSWTSLNGSKKGSCSYPGYSGTVFEPIDEFKGDFARTYFYMATRYEDVISGWSSDVLDGSSDKVYVDWYLSMMIEWHQNDPVSSKEINRNNAVYDIQGNANPFIDHPEWVCEIWGCTIDPEPSEQATNLSATASSHSQIDLIWTKAGGTDLPDGYLIKINTTGSFTTPTDGNDPTTDTDFSDGEGVIKASGASHSVTGLSGSTTYYFKMWSYTNSGSNIDFKTDGTPPEANATTLEAANILNSEDFSNCADASWHAVSVESNADWTCSDEYGNSQINGFGADSPSDDYLISDPLNLDNYSDLKISFDSYTKYSDDGNNPAIELLYSTNYSGDPGSANWNTISVNWPETNSQTWTSSGEIDISDISGSSVVFAFHYTSTGTGSGESAIWRIDNIEISGYNSGPSLKANPVSLSGYTYTEGNGPSVSQSFSLSGSDLDGTDIILSAPTNYEISLDNSNFDTSRTITDSHNNYNGTDLTATDIYIRLKAGLAIGTYNSENLSISGGGASDISVSNSGEVSAISPSLSADPENLSGYIYTVGNGPSVSQSFSLTGSNLNGTDITVSASTNYEVALNNADFGASQTITDLHGNYTQSDLSSTKIYVRLKAGLTAGDYHSENITISGGGASIITVEISGKVTNIPTLSANPESLSGYAYTKGSGPSDSQSFSLTGSDLDGTDLTVSAPTNYEVALNNVDFGASQTITDLHGNYTQSDLSSTKIYVRLKAGLAVGFYESKNVTVSGGGAEAISVVNNGEVLSETTSVTNNSSDNTIILFPNPGTDRIFLNSSGKKIKHIIIADLSGKIVVNKNFKAVNAEIAVNHLSKGMYFIEIHTQSEIVRQIFIKQ